MGFIYEPHGRISIEGRGESFRIHPTYGFERVCPACHGEPPIPIMGECAGGCTKAYRDGLVDEPGHVPDFQDEAFGRVWREQGHPEFLIEDLDDLIEALVAYREEKR